jgi:AhpD family alkylhydroperoxidase
VDYHSHPACVNFAGMKERFIMKDVQPGAYNAMMALEQYINGTDIPLIHKELIKIRASQLNGCAFCIDKHTQDARRHGETEQRLYLLNAWREAPQFSEEEKIVLAMTEEITHISRQGLTHETYAKALQHFGEARTAQLIMAVTIINAWNRIGISSHRIPPLS